MTAINCSSLVIALLNLACKAMLNLREAGWHCGERAHLLPVWSGFESWMRCLKRVEFIVRCQVALRRFFSRF